MLRIKWLGSRAASGIRRQPSAPIGGALAIVALFASGCAPLTVLNSTVGTGDYRLIQDQAYGTNARQRLDVYVPRAVKTNADVVLFFYGGRWRSGAKGDYRFVAERLTANGLITVIADYRVYPQVDWRAFVADGASAYRWVEKNIASYGGNAHRIFLMGHSAGAHIAALVALDQNLRARAGSSITPCGMIGLAGPYDFLPFEDADVKQVFGSAAQPMETQPIYYVDRSGPSLLLLTGNDDTTVKPRNTYRLAEAMQRAGGKAQTITYDNIGHVGILLSLSRWLRFLAPSVDDTTNFIRNTDCRSK